MKPTDYDNWYASKRGRWIGATEYRLILDQLRYQPGDTILDVGCGTGWFTRRFAGLPEADMAGIDIDRAALAFAGEHDRKTRYMQARAEQLPFTDSSIDRVISVTALNFVPDWPQGLREIVRVARQRFVIGLLNRHSLLWREKGQGEDQGAYRGAHWHTHNELLSAFDGLPVANLQLRSAIWFPSGSRTARAIERCIPNRLLFGSFLLVSGDKAE